MNEWGVYLTTTGVPWQSQAEVIQNSIMFAKAAEDMGYNSVWTLEHHFTRYGLAGCCTQLSAFLLGATKRLKVGSAITVLPLYHPVRLAEDVAMLDQASKGRFIFGVGRGHFFRDFKVFGSLLAGGKEAVAQSNNHRVVPLWLDIIRSAWLEGKVSASNEFLSFDEIEVFPEPYTKPHPPVVIASTSSTTIEYAAKHGLSMLLDFTQDESALISQVELWSEVASRCGRDPVGQHVLSCMVVLGGPKEMEQSRRTLRFYEHEGSKAIGLGRPEVDSLPNYERHFRELDELIQRGEWEMETRLDRLFRINPTGSPEQVAEKLQRVMDATGITRVNCAFESLGDPESVLSQMKLFAEQVRPLIKSPAVATLPQDTGMSAYAGAVLASSAE